MRIAVLSDSHNRLPESVCHAVRHADEIWHLGDVTDLSVIGTLRRHVPKVHVVRGNCDEYAGWPEVLQFEHGGIRFHLVHIPPPHVPADVDVVLHGHTHVPRDERISGVRFLNPGTVGGPTKGAPPSFAWLIIEDGQPLSWKVVKV